MKPIPWKAFKLYSWSLAGWVPRSTSNYSMATTAITTTNNVIQELPASSRQQTQSSNSAGRTRQPRVAHVPKHVTGRWRGKKQHQKDSENGPGEKARMQIRNTHRSLLNLQTDYLCERFRSQPRVKQTQEQFGSQTELSPALLLLLLSFLFLRLLATKWSDPTALPTAAPPGLGCFEICVCSRLSWLSNKPGGSNPSPADSAARHAIDAFGWSIDLPSWCLASHNSSESRHAKPLESQKTLASCKYQSSSRGL